MHAEALYPAIQSLPRSERLKILERLKRDLKVPEKKEKSPMLSDADARTYLITNFLKKKKPLAKVASKPKFNN